VTDETGLHPDTEAEPELIIPNTGGNAWDAVDSAWLDDVMRVQRRLGAYVDGVVRHAQEDPLAGMVANGVAELGRALVLIGNQMQDDARMTGEYVADFGVHLLKYLATLAPGERVSARHLIDRIGVFNGAVEATLVELVRSTAVDVRRPRVLSTPANTTYAITAKGRVLINPLLPEPEQADRRDDDGAPTR